MTAAIVTSRAGAVAKYCDEYVCLWVSLSVCVSIRISPEPLHIPGTTRVIFTKVFVHVASRDLYQICFVHDAYICGSILLQHVYDRPHRVSLGGVFFPIDNAYISGTTSAAIFTIFFVCVACVFASVLLQHVDDRPHHVSLGRGFLPH